MVRRLNGVPLNAKECAMLLPLCIKESGVYGVFGQPVKH